MIYFRIPLLLTVLFWLCIAIATQTYAQSPTESNSATPTKTTAAKETSPETEERLDQIRALKDKIASKVGELRETDKGGVSGTIKSIEDATLTLVDDSTTYIVQFADDASIFEITENGKSTLDVKKLRSGDIVSAIGYFTDEKKTTLSGKFIYREIPDTQVVGLIKEKDAENFTITVSQKNTDFALDIEKFTRTFFSDAKGSTWVRGGFSKMQIGDFVHSIVRQDESNANTLDAYRIYVVFPAKSASPSAAVTVTPTKKVASISPEP